MSSLGGRAHVRVVPGRDPAVWVKREAEDLPTTALGEVGPDGWAPVLAECEISVGAGGVEIHLTGPYEPGVDDPDEVTGYFPIEQVMAEHVAAPHLVGDHDTLQHVSAEQLAAENLVSEPPQAADPAPNLRGPTGTWPVPRPGAEPPKPTSGPPAIPVTDGPDASGPQARSVGLSFSRAWRETSPPRKVLAVLLPFALAFSIVAVVRRSRAPARTPAPSPHASIASAATSAGAPVAKASAQAAAPAVEPPPLAAVIATANVDAGAPGKMPAKKTLERTAVDAVAAGSYVEALAHYEELSRRSPDVPAYRHAVRILKVKIAAGSGRP